MSAGSFFQTNRFLVDKLVEIVVGNQPGAPLSISTPAPASSPPSGHNFDQVIAVEASPHSFNGPPPQLACECEAAPYNNRGVLLRACRQTRARSCRLDPPRAGLGEKATKALGRMSASHVTYVSCDPATLSRDLRLLLESGFRVEQAHLVDMFPQTYHMETVLHLAR